MAHYWNYQINATKRQHYN